MGIQAPAQVKYVLIKDAVDGDGNQLSVATLCQIAGVSRSGYYSWMSDEPKRKLQEETDRADFELILNAYRFRGYAKGSRGIYMGLLHKNIRMNLKKIRRLMKKYGLHCPFRKPNPYKRMMKAMQTSNVAKNIVNRDFTSRGVRKVLLTDITYLFYKGHCCYLSTVLDAVTHEVLGYQVSKSLKVDFVLKTIDMMVEKHGSTLDEETIVHSDQGCHYTSTAFIEKLKDEKFIQSMSRKGNCWDNAPQESFFGHMKDEIRSIIAKCSTFEEVSDEVDRWMDYYNKDRYQWDLMKLSPEEYYEYLTTGIYPLSEYKPLDAALRAEV